MTAGAYPQPALTYAEIEFLSGDSRIDIVPNFNLPEAVYLMSCGPIGPFKTDLKASVPLWVAIHLKRSRKCHIVVPEWFNVVHINDRIDHEKKDHDGLQALPDHWLETASLLFRFAADDIPNLGKVKAALNVLESVRSAKLRAGLAQLSSEFSFAKLNNVSMMEIAQIRTFTTVALDQFFELAQESATDPSLTQSQTQS